MSIFLLIVAFAVILAGCELFVNGIEWFGRRLNLGEGAVGSVLAAVGTALPETVIPLIAILVQGGKAGDEVGIGAILGAPFMLSTLAIFVCGISVVIFSLTKRRTMKVIITRDQTMCDTPFIYKLLELSDHRICYKVAGRTNVNKAKVCTKFIEDRVVIWSSVKAHQCPARHILNPKVITQQNISLLRQMIRRPPQGDRNTVWLFMI